jgi:hypothetical protein
MSTLLPKELVETMTTVQKRLLSYVDIEINEHKILRDDISCFSSYVYEYIKDDFAKVKSSIYEKYSQKRISYYVDLLYHTKEYIELRYSSTTEFNRDQVINGLITLLEKFFQNDILNIDEDCYYIIFDQYALIREWAHNYVHNYAIVIAHMILTK